MNFPAELSYTAEHQWVRRKDEKTVVVGITDYAQAELDNVVFVDLPQLGRKVNAGDSLLVVESVKAISDVYAPVTGEIVAVNEALEDEPELVNQEPYGKAWLVEISMTEDLPSLLTAQEYEKMLG
ncbi:glycine cleavage system protein GcvH [uncultured Anaeromusa sp.]|uniref:glycine cleavage system protein GcvH n=1 Tax=uncultured Anaeromusa sp. TaxID=673273 RepID=UPI0029C94ED8|nr:glycine cleavage system protein GcvH [uncultured Anaeromusa sp.]